MSFQPFPPTRSCSHQKGGNYAIHVVSPSIKETPLIPWPSLTRWDMVEEWYAPLTLEGDRILIHREAIAKKEEAKQEDSLWVDYVSEKVNCPQAPEGSPCWMRYAYLYCPTDKDRPKLYQINGTSISF